MDMLLQNNGNKLIYKGFAQDFELGFGLYPDWSQEQQWGLVLALLTGGKAWLTAQGLIIHNKGIRPCQGSVPRQFSRTFRCVMLADAEVALSLEPQAEMRSRLQRFCKLAAFWLHNNKLFSDKVWLKWHHLRTFLSLHTAPSRDTKLFLLLVSYMQ